MSSLTCAQASVTGSLNDACTVTLSAPAPQGGLTVYLKSRNTAYVTVPASVTVPATATSVGFSAVVSYWQTTSQSVTLIAAANWAAATFVLNLVPSTVPSTRILSPSTTSLSFGNVALNQVATMPLTVKSSGTLPVTINSATVTGSGFSVSGASFPVTLSPGQTLTLNVAFQNLSGGAATGQLSISSTANVGTPNIVVNLSGNGSTTAGPNFSVNTTSIAFGNVALGSSATQSVVVTSTGTQPVTIFSATLTGSGSTAFSSYCCAATLAPGQTATGYLEFAPTTAGKATATLNISSNSSTTPSVAVTLTGTGGTATHQVNLSWNAPSNSSVPITGYYVYRSMGTSSSYSLLTSWEDTLTSYIDSTVQSGQTYSYVVKSVDAAGDVSAASNSTTVTIP